MLAAPPGRSSAALSGPPGGGDCQPTAGRNSYLPRPSQAQRAPGRREGAGLRLRRPFFFSGCSETPVKLPGADKGGGGSSCVAAAAIQREPCRGYGAPLPALAGGPGPGRNSGRRLCYRCEVRAALGKFSPSPVVFSIGAGVPAFRDRWGDGLFWERAVRVSPPQGLLDGGQFALSTKWLLRG